MLGKFDFNPAPELNESDIKLFLADQGAEMPTIQTDGVSTLSGLIAATRTALAGAKINEFGALKDNIKIERKAGQTKTNYKNSKLNEATFTLVNCTKLNYQSAADADGTLADLFELDEANGMLKIYRNMKIEITEMDENKKHPEIVFKMTNDSFSTTAREVIDLKKLG